MRIYLIVIQLLAAFGLAHFSVAGALAQGQLVFSDQGATWTSARRSDFYTRDQGSRMIPLDWLRALKQANGQPFLADSFNRYGYLPNPSNPNGLPVGFTAVRADRSPDGGHDVFGLSYRLRLIES
jgi:hypothetical protein